MARPSMPREELLQKLSTVFREYGYEGASLARLSEATGLVKASLYYQFPAGKEDMAAAVLDSLADDIDRNVITPLGDATLPPAARLRAMSAGFDHIYGGGALWCLIDVFGVGQGGTLFRQHLSGAVARLIGAISDCLREAGVAKAIAVDRAEDALIAVQGSLVLARATGDPAAFKRVLAELPGRLLLAPVSS